MKVGVGCQSRLEARRDVRHTGTSRSLGKLASLVTDGFKNQVVLQKFFKNTCSIAARRLMKLTMERQTHLLISIFPTQTMLKC